MTTSLTLSFTLLSIFLIFALIGAWFLFSKKTINLKSDMRLFAIIISIIAIYFSSAFIRLELFASVGVLILGSIGLAILTQKIFSTDKKYSKIIFSITILILFIIPVSLPENNSWTSWSNFPPSILTGGSSFSNFVSNDWLDAMNWLKENTSEDAVIASWWDYGYWITTLSERTTLVDNATLGDFPIKKMAFSLITTPNQSWHILSSDYSTDISPYLGDDTVSNFEGTLTSEFEKNYFETHGEVCKPIFLKEAISLGVPEETCNPVTRGMDADYLLIYVSGERFYTDATGNIPLYTLEGGGDESKKAWFTKISNHQVSKFIESDNITPTKFFMENSTLGQLIPFSIIKYVEANTGRTFDQYYDGLIPVYVYDLKFLDPENDPYILVYASPSFYNNESGIMSAVLIYKINEDYVS